MSLSFLPILLLQRQQAFGQVPVSAFAEPGIIVAPYQGFGRALRAFEKALRTYRRTARTSATASRGFGSGPRGSVMGHQKYGNTPRRYGSAPRGFGNCPRAMAFANGERAPPHRSDSACPHARTRAHACIHHSTFHSFQLLTIRNHGKQRLRARRQFHL